MKVSTLLGFRANNEPMSYNEVMWWQAYSAVGLMKYDRDEMAVARQIGLHAGKAPHLCMVDWFDPNRDPEIEAMNDAKIVAELEELDRKHKEKLKNGTT